MRIVQYQPDHLLAIIPQKAQMTPDLDQSTEYARGLHIVGDSFTAMDGDKVLCCAGVFQLWRNRGTAWAILADEAAPHMLEITRAVRRYLTVCGFDRVETAVETEFPEGHRWAKLLGFTREGTMKKYGTDGRDYDLYARVK